MFHASSKRVPNVFQKCSKSPENPPRFHPFQSNSSVLNFVPYRKSTEHLALHTISRKIHSLVVTYKFHPCRNYLLNLRQNQNNPKPSRRTHKHWQTPSSPEHQIIINTQRLNITNPPPMFTASMRQTSPTTSRTTLQRCQNPTHTFPVYKFPIQRQSSPQTSP